MRAWQGLGSYTRLILDGRKLILRDLGLRRCVEEEGAFPSFRGNSQENFL